MSNFTKPLLIPHHISPLRVSKIVWISLLRLLAFAGSYRKTSTLFVSRLKRHSPFVVPIQNRPLESISKDFISLLTDKPFTFDSRITVLNSLVLRLKRLRPSLVPIQIVQSGSSMKAFIIFDERLLSSLGLR